LAWLARPMITKMSTQATSSTTATRAERMGVSYGLRLTPTPAAESQQTWLM
jgi:hypothetical protein